MAYSRLASVEEKKNLRSAIFYVLLSIVALAILFVFGIPALGKVAAFVSDLGKSGKQITSTDKTPPAPPSFTPFNQFTNQQNISLTGSTEPGATVKLTFDGSEQDALGDKNGGFTFNVQLTTGENTFSAIAIDTAGNTSQKTQDYKITFDNKPPNLTVDSPSDGTQFFGSAQRQITIKGTTDSGDNVTVNDRIVIVEDNGAFQYTTTLNDGSNPFAIKATDQAGNTTEKDITLTFNP